MSRAREIAARLEHSPDAARAQPPAEALALTIAVYSALSYADAEQRRGEWRVKLNDACKQLQARVPRARPDGLLTCATHIPDQAARTAELRSISTQFPEHAPAHYTLGGVLWDRGDRLEAVEKLRQAVHAEKRALPRRDYRVQLIDMLDALGRHDEAARERKLEWAGL